LLEPPILILDDPTASVDARTEQDIVSALRGAIDSTLGDLPPGLRRDDEAMREAVRRALRRLLNERLGKRPLIVPHIMEV
jgi:mRNA degradation ribonuclease J1/J2